MKERHGKREKRGRKKDGGREWKKILSGLGIELKENLGELGERKLIKSKYIA